MRVKLEALLAEAREVCMAEPELRAAWDHLTELLEEELGYPHDKARDHALLGLPVYLEWKDREAI